MIPASFLNLATIASDSTIGCFLVTGAFPVIFEADPLILDSVIGELSIIPSFNVSKIVLACLTSLALSNAFNTLTFLFSVKFFDLKILLV